MYSTMSFSERGMLVMDVAIMVIDSVNIFQAYVYKKNSCLIVIHVHCYLFLHCMCMYV